MRGYVQSTNVSTWCLYVCRGLWMCAYVHLFLLLMDDVIEFVYISWMFSTEYVTVSCKH